MADARGKYVAPSTQLNSFNCPHCGALAAQTWFNLFAKQLDNGKLPSFWLQQNIAGLTFDDIENREERDRYIKSIEKFASGTIGIFYSTSSVYSQGEVENLVLSLCYSCNSVTVWHRDTVLWPAVGTAPLPNPDLSDDVKRDYLEASAILALSPRGAAALLRLCIQKICKELGERGENINADIAALVTKGLDPKVQQALDIVRVTGNNAVHPGAINLSDNAAIAESLFGLVNLIAEIMISRPKHVEELYSSLPPGALEAISKRDGAKV